MPLNSSVVGHWSAPVRTVVDARWMMAYAAGLGETADVYFDTREPGGVVGHPLFPVCVEWVAGHSSTPPEPSGLTADERRRAVHLEHAVEVHAPVRPGAVLTTSQVVAARHHRAGVLLTTRIHATRVDDGSKAWTTLMSTLFRDVDVDGGDASIEPVQRPKSAPAARHDPIAVRSISLGKNAAHVYTECSRIWNPIHTDRALALAVGLPDIILHGTATLGLGVSTALELVGEPDGHRVRGVHGRFGAIVVMPSDLTVRVLRHDGPHVHFEVRTSEDALAVRDGGIILGPAAVASAVELSGSARTHD